MKFAPPVRIPYSERQVFAYTGADQVWNVPAYVTSVRIKCWGAGGGGGFATGQGGGGGFTQADLAVTPGEALTVRVGAAGNYGQTSNTEYPDGHPAYWGGAGSGGGSSSVTKSGVNIGAGGGGGAGDGNTGVGAQNGDPGGSSTAAAPSGGDGGQRFDADGGGGGGGASSTTGGTNTTVTPGSGGDAGNNGDVDYSPFAGRGGYDGASGNHGRIVILF